MPSTVSPLTAALSLEQASVIVDEALRLGREVQARAGGVGIRLG